MTEKIKNMKSIDKASVDYGREHNGTVNIEGFVAGANYVLNEVERLLNSQKFVDNPLNELFELIEQLKNKTISTFPYYFYNRKLL